MKKRGQSLVEFAAIIPIFVFVLLGIIEFSLYWKSYNVVQDIVFNASAQMASTYVSENSTANPAVDKALLVINDRSTSLGEAITLVDKSLPAEISARPFSVYKYESSQTTDTVSGVKPILTVIIDYSNPSKDGIVLQLRYQYKTILLGTELPLPGGNSVVIIPKSVEIVNNKTQQYHTY